MPLWFVSRGRFDDAQKQIEELKRDKERLTDRVAVLTGQAPLYATALVNPLPETRAEQGDVKPQGKRLTNRDLIAKAEADVRKRGPIAVPARSA